MISNKTTIAAIITFITILGSAALSLLDDDPKTNPNYDILFAAGATATGLLFARDNTVSDQEAGVRPEVKK